MSTIDFIQSNFPNSAVLDLLKKKHWTGDDVSEAFRLMASEASTIDTRLAHELIALSRVAGTKIEGDINAPV
ncbi:hypothetical protein [Paremcibacter congregatus]|uniref:hypothetical protein n=1 Tax=Paremcibacter congregatus TaxID=2043170 RepID=UPI003A8F451B